MDTIKLTSIKDVFRACCHTEENQQFPNTVISISKGYFEEDKEAKVDLCTSFTKAVPAFYCHEDALEVDLKFRNRMDINLKRTLDLYQQYRQEANDFYCNEEDSLYPSIQMIFIPIVTKGRYQLILADPELFILCSDNPNDYPCTIKFIFRQENVLVMESDNVDYNKIVADVKRQEDMDAFYEMEEEKKRQRDAYEAEHGINRILQK